jgi:hypothetical protein
MFDRCVNNRGIVAFCVLVSYLLLVEFISQSNTMLQKYLYAQFLGFNIITTTFLLDPHYSGDKITDHDVDTRIRILLSAIDHAVPFADRRSSTLKVFLAPEFYFRGYRGAYEVKGAKSVPIGDRLKNITLDSRLQHWLIICGSVVAMQAPDDSDTSRYVFYNAAPILFGSRRLLVFKKYLTSKDFLSVNTSRGVPNPHLECEHKNMTKLKCQYGSNFTWMMNHFAFLDYELVVNNSFDLGQTKIGIEICFDHKLGTLSRHLRSGKVDIHIIVAAGMKISRGPVMVPRHGPVFLIDGNGRSELNRNWFGRGSRIRYMSTSDYDVGPTFERFFTDSFDYSDQLAGSSSAMPLVMSIPLWQREPNRLQRDVSAVFQVSSYFSAWWYTTDGGMYARQSIIGPTVDIFAPQRIMHTGR